MIERAQVPVELTRALAGFHEAGTAFNALREHIAITADAALEPALDATTDPVDARIHVVVRRVSAYKADPLSVDPAPLAEELGIAAAEITKTMPILRAFAMAHGVPLTGVHDA